MKQWYATLVIYSSVVLAQNVTRPIQRENSFAVFGGMSVNAVAASDIVDYVNSVSTYAEQVDELVSAVDFFGGVEFPVGKEWGIKLEHTYLFKSYNFLGSNGSMYEIFYSVQAPSILVQKVLSGEGYFVKFGAGGGFHFGNASRKISTYGNNDFVAEGIGVKAEMIAQTAFDEHLYGYIGCHFGQEFLGEMKETATKQTLSNPNNVSESVSLNYFFAGIRFGIIYYL